MCCKSHHVEIRSLESLTNVEDQQKFSRGVQPHGTHDLRSNREAFQVVQSLLFEIFYKVLSMYVP